MNKLTKTALAITTIALGCIATYTVGKEKVKKELCGYYSIPQPPLVNHAVGVEVLKNGMRIYTGNDADEWSSHLMKKSWDTTTELFVHRLSRVQQRLLTKFQNLIE